MEHHYEQNSTDNNIKQFPRIFALVFSNQCGTDPASKQPSRFYVNNFRNCVKSCLASFKDSVVHPEVQININCLFKVTITEQLTTYHRLTDFHTLI